MRAIIFMLDHYSDSTSPRKEQSSSYIQWHTVAFQKLCFVYMAAFTLGARVRFSLGTNMNTPFFSSTHARIWAQCPSTLYSGTKLGTDILGTQRLNTAPFCAGARAPSVTAAYVWHVWNCVWPDQGFHNQAVSRKITPYKNLTKHYQDQQWIKVIDSSSQNPKIMLNGSEMSALSLLG